LSKLGVAAVFTGGDGVIVWATGDLDLATCSQLERSLSALQMDGRPNIVLDLSEVGFIDSSGLRVLVQAHRQARLWDGCFFIRGASDQALQLFRLTGLDDELVIESRLGAAAERLPG
jgi:anti-sigma B factor antagonist